MAFLENNTFSTIKEAIKSEMENHYKKYKKN